MKLTFASLFLILFFVGSASAQPHWIWKQGPATDEVVEFEKKLTLEAIPKNALLHAASDDSFDIHINGERVARSFRWKDTIKIDVAENTNLKQW